MSEPNNTGRGPGHDPSRYRLQRTERKKVPGKKRAAGAINTFSYIIFILGISLLLSAFIIVVGNDVLALVKPDKTYTLTVEKGESIGKVAGQLKDNGIIRYAWVFRLFASPKNTGALPEGEFTVNANMDYGQILSQMTTTTSYETVTLTIPEGYTLQQIAALLETSKVCTQEDFFNVANTYAFSHFMLKDVPMEENRLEGYLFPDTYQFYKASAKSLSDGDTYTGALNAINKMLNNFADKYTKSMRTLTEEKGLTIAEVINVASMVEKEANLPEERTTIAGVIYNRLNHSEKYPYLNVDATLLYVLGHKDKLTDADKQLDSPYNTYTSKGLPPTAICNPGLACIMAAIAPEEHNYYYYVYDPATESHIFSRTLEQHNAAVAKVNAE